MTASPGAATMKPPALPCPPQRWPVFSARLDRLLALPDASARAQALADLPADEADLATALARVLAAAEAAEQADTLQIQAGDGLQAGLHIGPYALLQELGRGGMGVVWLAERADGAYRRQVALKLPHRHLLENLNAAAVRERFARERDILAALTHAHIAAFYDAGVTADGRPWLALEAVQGQPITDWCRSQRLTLHARLQLFQQVLMAVEHAHARFVAHRDIKPANVLVTAAGQVKLLDFGIARLLDEGAVDPSATGALTRAGGVLATPRYAAPEQLNGGLVTAATDVHALGQMLHELLTGQVAPAAVPGAEDRRPPASRCLAHGHAASLGLGEAALRRQLRGDLDAILAQALHPDPTQRYDSVEALAADLARWQRHLPVRARRLGAAQRAWRFARRHWLGLSLGLALALALLGGAVGMAWQARAAAREAQRADAIRGYLLGLLVGADPRQAGTGATGAARDLTVKQVLDSRIEQILAELPGDPRTAEELLEMAGRIYVYLGEGGRSTRIERRRIELLQARLGAGAQPVLDARLSLVWSLQSAGEVAQSAQQIEQLARLLAPPRPPDRLLAELALARHDQLVLSQAPAAQRLQALQQALALYQRLAPQDAGHPAALQHLALLQLEAGQAAAARASIDQALALDARVQPPIVPQRARLFGARARVAAAQGDLAAALADSAQAVDLARRSLGLVSPGAWALVAQRMRLLCAQPGSAPRAQAQRLLAELGEPVPGARALREAAAACGLDLQSSPAPPPAAAAR
ncbi:MAG: serine/threonine protein kinase [Burkholderiaceae bacterium]|nr:serine/threonine protein kinase [Burkholderiaceae bacterium]